MLFGRFLWITFWPASRLIRLFYITAGLLRIWNMRDYGPDLFAGTAKYYARYRAKYPLGLFGDAAAFFGLDGRGRLLDLGCGTGELAIPLSKYFEEVLALDPEPEMLEQGRRRPQPPNIIWKIGSSSDITEVKGPFRLAALGQSLHWMDAKTVLRQLYDLLEPGGGLIVIGAGGSDPPAPNRLTAAKDEAIKDLIIKYLGPRRRAGSAIYVPSGLSWENDLFPNSKFGGFEKRVYVSNELRDVEQELGNLYSMSWARRDYFGSNAHQFECEFRRRLARISRTGKFRNRLVFDVYYLKQRA